MGAFTRRLRRAFSARRADPATSQEGEFREFLAAGSGPPPDEVFRERLWKRLRPLASAQSIKFALASTFDATGLNGALLSAQSRLRLPWARALNYHDVPPGQARVFEEHLRFYARHFVPVGLPELLELHAGRWPHPKPGLLLTFDDGIRCHADVVAPLLEKYGFPGWFMVPIGFVEAPVEEQKAYAREHSIVVDASAYPDGRVALSWQDLRRLDGRHVVCCHTLSHTRMRASLSRGEMEREIAFAKQRMEEGLGHPVDAFTWVGGEEWSYSAEAARVVREAGFRFGFMTNYAVIRPGCDLLQLQRTNIEVGFPPELLRFSLSGFYDLMYAPKRRRVNALTSAAA
jgi:peptidoglycan/xylan/chitin deacetylase (PgdA/CDA1 family)